MFYDIQLVLYYLVYIYMGICVVSIILSWITPIHNSGFYKIINKISGAYLDTFRGKLVLGGLDFTPIIGMLLLGYILSALLV